MDNFKLIRELIRIKSVTGMEGEIQKYILNFLTSCGLEALKVKDNVVVLIKGTDQNKCLIFNAHVDTVSAGDIKFWKKDPFSGLEEKGRVCGLGASDNKASVATLLMLVKALSFKKPNCDVILIFTVGEEVDGHGTDDTVKHLSAKYLKQYKNISAVVCEPTGLESIGLAHKGNLFLKIIASGKSGHGSKPVKDHSVLKMCKIIEKLEGLDKKWTGKYKNAVLGKATIGLATSIKAGDEAVPNKFPESCSATFDIRTIPEMHSLAFTQIKKAVGKLGKVEYLYPPVTFGYTNKSEKIVKVFKTVTKAKLIVFPGSSDMPFFTQEGIPTVIFGPGEMKVIHKPNEYCYAHKVEKCVDIFLHIIKGYNDIDD